MVLSPRIVVATFATRSFLNLAVIILTIIVNQGEGVKFAKHLKTKLRSTYREFLHHL